MSEDQETTAAAVEGTVEDVPQELNGSKQLQISVKTSVITQQPVGILIKVGDEEHVTNIEGAEQIALNLFRMSGYLAALQNFAMQSAVERSQKPQGIVGPNGSPLV
jgi:hypothetical protein